MTSFKNILLGFVAGAMAALTVHELVKACFVDTNIISASWDVAEGAQNTIAGLPHLANAVLWGGFWGIIFALIFGNRPEGALTFRGALLGILGPAIAVSLLIAPLVLGHAPFAGGDVRSILAILATFAAFGASTAWLYGWFTAGLRLP